MNLTLYKNTHCIKKQKQTSRKHKIINNKYTNHVVKDKETYKSNVW